MFFLVGREISTSVAKWVIRPCAYSTSTDSLSGTVLRPEDKVWRRNRKALLPWASSLLWTQSSLDITNTFALLLCMQYGTVLHKILSHITFFFFLIQNLVNSMNVKTSSLKWKEGSEPGRTGHKSHQSCSFNFANSNKKQMFNSIYKCFFTQYHSRFLQEIYDSQFKIQRKRLRGWITLSHSGKKKKERERDWSRD